jgi:hypothetical protein
LFFDNHPFDNKFYDLCFDYENRLEDLRVELHMANERDKIRRKRYLIIGGICLSVGGIAGIIGGFKLHSSLSD